MRIDIKGTIIPNNDKRIYDWCEMDSVCPRDVQNIIDQSNGQQLDVYINSGGGNLFAGVEIYSALRAYKGQVFIHVIYAGSAASIIACAGKSDITPTGMFMYHNVVGGAQGDYHTMDKTSNVLQTANKAVCAAYVLKTGKSEKELLAMMDKETWLTAQQAVEYGFIDKIAESQNIQLVAADGSPMLPQSVIDKIRNTVKIPQGENQADFLMQEKELLNFYKTKGAMKNEI